MNEGGIEMREFKNPTNVRWTPQEDITPYELALALHTLMPALLHNYAFDVAKSVREKPANVQRHFTLVAE